MQNLKIKLIIKVLLLFIVCIIIKFSRRKLFFCPVHEHLEASSFVNIFDNTRFMKFLALEPPTE